MLDQCFLNYLIQGCPRCVVANVLVCDNLVNEFEYYSRYCANFQIETLGEKYEFSQISDYGINITSTVSNDVHINKDVFSVKD